MAATKWIPGAKADRVVWSQSRAAFFFFVKRNIDGDDRFALNGSSFSDSDLNSADELLSEHQEPLAGNKEQ